MVPRTVLRARRRGETGALTHCAVPNNPSQDREYPHGSDQLFDGGVFLWEMVTKSLSRVNTNVPPTGTTLFISVMVAIRQFAATVVKLQRRSHKENQGVTKHKPKICRKSNCLL